MGTSNYEQLTDEQLIRNLRDGDKKIMDYIMEKYKNVVRKEAKAMYLIGGENDDLIQEGSQSFSGVWADPDLRVTIIVH